MGKEKCAACRKKSLFVKVAAGLLFWLAIRPKRGSESEDFQGASEAKPTPLEVERGAGALVPFVRAWNLGLNPENLDEMAYAVLLHSRSDADWDSVEKEVDAQIADFHDRWNPKEQEVVAGLSPKE